MEQELGHDPGQYQLQMDHNRQVHILPRSQLEDAEQSKVKRPKQIKDLNHCSVLIILTQDFRFSVLNC